MNILVVYRPLSRDETAEPFSPMSSFCTQAQGMFLIFEVRPSLTLTVRGDEHSLLFTKFMPPFVGLEAILCLHYPHDHGGDERNDLL